MSQITYRVGELASSLTDLEVCKRVARYAESGVLDVMIELIEAMSETASLVSTKTVGYWMPTRDDWTFKETY